VAYHSFIPRDDYAQLAVQVDVVHDLSFNHEYNAYGLSGTATHRPSWERFVP